MSAEFVLDCSMTLAWAFADERTAETEAVRLLARRENVYVPAHWFLEVTNGLLMSIKRKRITEADAKTFLTTLKAIDLEIDTACVVSAFDVVLDLALKHRLTSSDAAYLELAHRRKLPLASLDDPLRSAAISLGIPVLGK